MDPDDKRLAIAVPDHSLSYFGFEGRLAEETYLGPVRSASGTRANTRHSWIRKRSTITENDHYLRGQKVRGEFILTRMSNQQNNWLLIKREDKYADVDWKLKTVLKVK